MLRTGLERLQAQGAKSLEASAYQYLGMLYQAQGNATMAIASFDQAIALATELGLPRAEEWPECDRNAGSRSSSRA